MAELSTRIWLDEELWDRVRRRAVAEGVTIRELLPRLVGQAAGVAGTGAPAGVPVVAPPAAAPAGGAGGGPPVVPPSDVYRCALCGAEVRLGGLNHHMSRHLKEQAVETERS